MRKYEQIGIIVPTVLLPKGVEMSKWAVVACDQYTSQPEYWKSVRDYVGSAPSTLNLMLPEIYLETPEEKKLSENILKSMKDYGKILEPHEGFVYLERKIGDKIRHGLIVALDLEQYDYSKGSKSLVRATEGTIVERLPPRMKIRRDAELELPHIMVLIDDPKNTVIEPLKAAKKQKLYDFELMKNGGHATGFLLSKQDEEKAAKALEALKGKQANPLLYAMGDGNHSLASAKAVWEEKKAHGAPADSPARYALVELVNVHDEALEFEPIHRILLGLKKDVKQLLMKELGAKETKARDEEDMTELVNSKSQAVGYVDESGFHCLEITKPTSKLSVGSLQSFLDKFLKDKGAEKIDYVHGLDVVVDLGRKKGNCGFYLPGMPKSMLFPAVISDGALPRKTFSMGEAHEKRYYLECRKIR